MENLETFLSQAAARSRENAESFALLQSAGKFGVCIGLIRQELDTLIRLVYLWRKETEVEELERLVALSAAGRRWDKVTISGKKIPLTDREMLGLAAHLGGWEEIVYSLGCKLIHLSDFHLYRTSDPVKSLAKEDQREIIEYLGFYHGRPRAELDFPSVVDYLPRVMEKIVGNVEFYIQELGAGRSERDFFDSL